MTILQHSIAQAAAAATGYQISRSLRLNIADSANLSRTNSVAGNTKTFTLSIWLKRSSLGSLQNISGYQQTSVTDEGLGFNANDTIGVAGFAGATSYAVSTTAVFRDTSAFYHIVCAIDTTQATAANRMLIYVNNVLQATTGTPVPQNYDFRWLTGAFAQTIGAQIRSGTPSNFFGGYIAEARLVDAQALTPSSFGQVDATTGVWSPKAYTGTYGTNGFYLNFSDNSGTTATTLGKDSSGNGNNWTPNNFSVAAGIGNDSFVDSPTNYGTDTGAGGEVRGNYATLNPLKGPGALTNGNLDWTFTSAGYGGIFGTVGMSSGKWYWEATVTTALGSSIGIATEGYTSLTSDPGLSSSVWMYYSSGQKYNGTGTAYGGAMANGDVIGVAFDADLGSLTFYKNGVSQGTAFSSLAANTYFPLIGDGNGSATPVISVNFGQRPWSYTAPSGFKALCTTNLPTPAIGASASTLANKNFDVVTRSGSASSTQTVSSLSFAPDFVWIKNRSQAWGSSLNDIVRGVNKTLYSNTATAETANDTDGYLSAFSSNGYTLTDGSLNGTRVKGSGDSYVDWLWKAGGAAVTNNSGSISSSVSANTAAGVSVVGWTGNGVNNATIGHGLGVAPKLVITKRRDASQDWVVYSPVIGGGSNALTLNATSQQYTASAGHISTFGANTLTLTQGSSSLVNLNASAATYVAYCFAEVAGFSKFGSYTGNGSADGPFVYCGFRPRYVLIKRTDTTANWIVWDTARSPYNQIVETLLPNTSGAETTSAGDYIDALSNGFKLRSTGTAGNASGGTYIFAAFAEAPFNYARAR